MIDLNQFMRRTQADKLYVKKDEVDELLKGSMQSVTYAELKALRDNGQLVAGRQYRITDYECTTTQENTRSAGHQFDIIVTADSESVLNENARAIQHEEILDVDISEGGILKTGAVTKYYDIYEDFGDEKGTDYKAMDAFIECRYAENNEGETVPVLYKTDIHDYEGEADYDDAYFYVGRYEYEGETYDRWRKIEDNELTWDSTGKVYALTNIIVDDNGVFNPDIIDTRIIDTYFAKSNLSAWELKYSLDNDRTSFLWAKDKFAFMCSRSKNTYIYVRYPDGDNENGFAWAYLTDSGDLQFTDIEDWTDIDSEDLIYTPTENIAIGEIYDMSGEDVTVVDLATGKGVIYYMKDEWDNECHYDFKNIQYLKPADWFSDHGDWCNNVLGYVPEEDMWFYTFTWVNENDEAQDLTLIGNTLINDEGKITGVFGNKIGITSEYILYLTENSIQALPYNVFVSTYHLDGGICYGCHSNTLRSNCIFNTFGNNCNSNTLGSDCVSNTLGNNCIFNTFEGNCSYNTLGDTCDSNTFGTLSSDNTFGISCYGNTFGFNCYSNIFGDECVENSFGNNCYGNVFGDGCSFNSFGNNCYGNAFGDDANNSGEILNYCRHIIYENGVSYVNIRTDETNIPPHYYLQNIKVCSGLQGESTQNPLWLPQLGRNNNFQKTFVAKDSNTEEIEV